MQLCERLIPGTYATFGDKKLGVLPAVMFPLEKGVDRLIITPDGEEAPALNPVCASDGFV
jgi:hypothetical protein